MKKYLVKRYIVTTQEKIIKANTPEEAIVKVEEEAIAKQEAIFKRAFPEEGYTVHQDYSARRSFKNSYEIFEEKGNGFENIEFSTEKIIELLDKEN